MRLPLIAMLCAILPPAAQAGPTVERIDVLDTGTYAIETGSATADPAVPQGETVAVIKATLIKEGATIPAMLGTEFGFRYVVRGAPEGEAVALDFVVTAPEPGLADPAADGPILTMPFTRDKIIGVPNYFGYYLEAPWEAVPGTWHFEIRQDGRTLAERTFTLTAPE